MRQSIYGLLLWIVLALPPVAHLLESIMVMHMHMQMPLLVVAGVFMARFFQTRIPRFFEKWNHNGIPGILLFVIIMVYWMIPRTMDEALMIESVQIFKFISLPFLAGIPLRDSWKKISSRVKTMLITFFTFSFIAMGLLYISWPEQLCNSYLIIEQMTLGWSFLTMGVCMLIYLGYAAFTDHKL